MTTLRHRPIYGGVFGKGRYSLASMPCMAAGLHAVRYMVIEPKAGAVLAVADDKVQALQSARRVLRAVDTLAGVDGPTPTQGSLWPDEEVPPVGQAGVRSVSRRRRDVFDRSGGRCHYCGTVLQLAGQWHIEHQVPRALDGTDAPLNLVAACVRCNLAKSDRTALEFMAAGEQVP